MIPKIKLYIYEYDCIISSTTASFNMGLILLLVSQLLGFVRNVLVKLHFDYDMFFDHDQLHGLSVMISGHHYN